MFDSSVIELSKSALTKNLRFLHNEFGQNVLVSSVVKGNAYGHGIDPFVPLAESCGVCHFSVFDAAEAYKVKQCQTMPDTDVMIMGFVNSDGLEWAIENSISFYVFDPSRLELARKFAKQIGKPARIHLELETGMNRTGLHGEDFERVVQLVLTNRDCLKVEGVCTHFAGAERTANYKRIETQIADFNKLCEMITELGLAVTMQHSASSAAALTYPDTRMDMVRIGVAQYGLWPSSETESQYLQHKNDKIKKQSADPLRPVLHWSSRIMHVAAVAAGEFVGYGSSYITTRPQRIATVPVGYSHGFRRSLSNRGKVLIHGERADVLGLVNMSMMLVDVTSIASVEVGDEVVLIGKQKDVRISVGPFSDEANLVNYEMLARLPSNIPRVVVT